VNVQVGPYEVDFLWRDPNVIVETDGFATHGGRAAFGRDKGRDRRLSMMGYSVQRFAYQHIVERAGFVADVVRTLLDASRPRS
jgi:very-short-patch-repair endonuclease